MSGIGTKIIVTTTRKGIPGSEVAALVAETGWEYVPGGTEHRNSGPE